MADSKKEAPKEENWLITYFPIVLIGILMLIGSQLDNETIFGEKKTNAPDVTAEEKLSSDIYDWIGRDGFSLGGIVINTEDTVVRTAPAGPIVGTQKKLESGRLLEGPVEQFQTTWWRIDYPSAPDGWVQYTSVSPKTKTVKLLNIVPILYGFYKPIGYSLLFLLLLGFAYFKLMLRKEDKITGKKLELKSEQYKETEKTIEQKIEEKPDVQELPGFQTEEIFKTPMEQKSERWKHIQELIKSYNANDWRQAIIEADIILEEMLDKMGYEGNTIGEKLKTIEKSDFITLDKAWSAHRVRNQIAHSGSTFELTRDVAEKTIKDFEMVFKEFYYI